jgi:hypothetical protein
MTQAVIGTPEQAYVRDALFGVELLDPVTLERVSRGVKVVAVGLQGRPIVSAGGLFVWLREDLGNLQKITIDPLLLPYLPVELTPADLPTALTTVELPPRVDYPFTAGVTGSRGVLIEEQFGPPVPVADARVRLQWLDENNVWRDAPTVSRTNADGGFATILRFSPTEVPLLDADGLLTVRLHVRRDATSERSSADWKQKQGRIRDALTFAWDELQP